MATASKSTTEHAPQGKIDLSNVASWTPENKVRLTALQASDDLTEEEEAELLQLVRARRQHNAQRTSSITDTKEALKHLGIGITDLFTKEEILAAAREYQEFGKGTPAKKASSSQGSTKKGASVVTDEMKASSMLTIDTGSRPFLWTKGRKWDSAPYLSDALAQFKSDAKGADLKEYVLSKVTPQGKEYLTGEGASELTAFVDHLTKKKPAPKKK